MEKIKLYQSRGCYLFGVHNQKNKNIIWFNLFSRLHRTSLLCKADCLCSVGNTKKGQQSTMLRRPVLISNLSSQLKSRYEKKVLIGSIWLCIPLPAPIISPSISLSSMLNHISSSHTLGCFRVKHTVRRIYDTVPHLKSSEKIKVFQNFYKGKWIFLSSKWKRRVKLGISAFHKWLCLPEQIGHVTWTKL